MKTSWMKRMLCLMLSAVLLLGHIPASAFAEEAVPPEETVAEEVTEAPSEPTEVTEPETSEPTEPETSEPTEPEETEPETSAPVEETSEPTEETQPEIPEVETVEEWAVPDVEDWPSDEELFGMYAEGLLYGNMPATFGTAAGERLTGNTKLAYDALKPYIQRIARGEVSDTSITMGYSHYGINLNGVYGDYVVDIEVPFVGTEKDTQALMYALMADLPYELYWFDKTTGMGSSSFDVDNQLQWTVYFPVAGNYAPSGATGGYTADTAKTGAAATAAANAASVVAAAANLSDYEKLVYYKEYICGAVSYDWDAYYGSMEDDGYFGTHIDSWQLIHVFDGNTSTNVVCEGYSKAFQYLCDLTDFDGDVICYSASGVTASSSGSGGHMWNIVSIGGESYLVDVTNSDSGMIGQNGGLFLVGGTMSDGAYYFTIGSQQIAFAYDSNMESQLGSDVITLSTNAEYEPPVEESIGGQCGDNVFWTFDEATHTLTISGEGDMTEYSYSSSVPWRNYTSIIRRIVVEEGVTSIGKYAFYDCDGTEISLPEGITSIGDYAFYACYAAEIILPEGITRIGYDAFGFCINLVEITIPEGVTEIGDFAFYYCSALEKVTLSEDVTSIGDKTFIDCSALETIVFEGSCPAFGESVFEGVTATAYYPADNETWTEDKLQDYGGDITWAMYGQCGENVYWTLDENGLLTILGQGDMYDFGYEEDDVQRPWKEHTASITKVVIEDGVTSIGNYAFYLCGYLAEVSIADSITRIGDYGFMHDAALMDVVLPNGLKELGACAFAYCSGLTEIQIPGSVSVIGDNAFYICNYLVNVTIEEGVTEIGNAFSYCGRLQSINIPSSVTSIGNSAFSHCHALNQIHIPESVTRIGSLAFEGCISLTEITFTGDAPAISENAFHDVIATAYYPLGNKTWTDDIMQNYGGDITWEAMIDCSHEFADGVCTKCGVLGGQCGENVYWTLYENGQLTIYGQGDMSEYSDTQPAPWNSYSTDRVKRIVVKNGITSIGNYAFYGCGTAEVILPEGITAIKECAFGSCGKLTEITIPASVTEISDRAFDGAGLKRILFIGDAPAFGQQAFAAVTSDICYPGDGSSWTEEVMQNYGGEIRWLKYFKVGRNVYCTLDDGLLTIFGSGEMFPINSEIENPWYNVRNQIQKVIIENGVTNIRNFAFRYCSNLSEVVIPESVTRIDTGAFGVCYSLTEISIPDGVTSIGTSAFGGCSGLIKIAIPKGVHEIYNSTFYGCSSLSDIVIPEGVTSIGIAAFRGCESLTVIDIPQSVVSIGNQAFENCCGLTEISIPDSVTCISQYTFSGCTGLTKAAIPDSVVSIEAGAFEGCRRLTEIVVPEGVASIGVSAFYGCDGLEKVVLSDSVTSIEESAFAYCSSLTEFVFVGDAPAIASNTFYFDDVMTAYYPAGNETWTSDKLQNYGGDINWAMYGQCGENVYWTLDENGLLTIYGSGDMYDYQQEGNQAPWHDQFSLYDETYENGIAVVIEEGVTSIGDYAFSQSFHLSGITIADSVTRIGDYGFANSVYVPEIILPDSIREIGKNAFSGCQSITSMAIPEGVTEISDHMFADCIDLVSVTLPDSVTKIGELAFWHCGVLTDVELPENLTSIGCGAFNFCESLTGMVIPNGVTEIGSSAFNYCNSLERIVLPEGIAIIEDRVFSSCEKLTEITIPASVTEISDYAFIGAGLERILFTGDAPAFGALAFSAVTSEAHYPANNATWTADVMLNYGGTITWEPYGAEPPAAVIGDAAYDSLDEALAAAKSGDTITLMADTEVTDLLIRSGVTVDLGEYDLKADSVIGFKGGILLATPNAGRLIVPKGNLILSEAGVNAKGQSILPVWDPANENYVFSLFVANTGNDARGLFISDDESTLYFQWKHQATGAINKSLMADNGSTDNDVSMLVRLQWGDEDGIAYQNYVFKDEFVRKVTGSNDYTVTLRGVETLGIDLDTLVVTAMITTESGAETVGTTWTTENAKVLVVEE